MAKTKKQDAAPLQLPTGHLNEIALVHIIPSKTNPRKNFDEAGLQELATSIKQVGIMQPIVVHCNDAGGFDLICGERRYRAARIAGLETIPAMVYPTLPEDLVFDLQITENLQRQDINAMEEADAFQEIVARRRGTPETIAQRLGKSTKYVYDRLALRKCVEPVQEAVRQGLMAIATAKKFAQLQTADQEALLESLGPSFETSRLERAVEALQLKLADAPFSTHDADLVPKAGACLSCPKRSGCNRLLFDDVQDGDICFDKACYEAKVAAWIDSVIDEVAARPDCGTVHRLSARYSPRDTKLLSSGGWSQLPEDAKSNRWGVIVELPAWEQEKYKLGQYFKIKLASDADEDGEDSDDDDDEGYPKSETVKSPKQEPVDHDEEIQKLLASPAIEGYLRDGSIYAPVQQITINLFRRLSYFMQCFVCEKLEVEMIEPERYNLTYEECAVIVEAMHTKYHSKGYGTANLLNLFEYLNKAADINFDASDLEDPVIAGWYNNNDIDARALVAEYCKANDWEVDGIWPEPDPEDPIND